MNIQKEIEKLRKKKNAIILAHNYQLPEIQDIADFVGDSLNLSIKAKDTKAQIIIFCGVYFMAETAKILSPQKKVLIPVKEAGCSLADNITVQQINKLKKKYPNAKVLCYVNTTAKIKAKSNVVCTSANAVEVTEKVLKDEEVIFVPDKYLGLYTMRKTNKKFILHSGYCPVHVSIRKEDVKRQKRLHPKARVLAHPECLPEVIDLADKVLSTEGMCRYAKETKSQEMIIATEIGILHRLRKENPKKKFYPASKTAVCPFMKVIRLKDVLDSLKYERYPVEVPLSVRLGAYRAIQEMLKVS